MKRSILLTGGTGLLGSNLVHRFLREGHRVHLLVRNPELEARSRIENAIRVIDRDFRLDKHDVSILSGDMTSPNCGLSHADVTSLRGAVDEVWHTAASVSFSYTDGEGTRRANVGGTRNVLELATAIGAPDFHHTSTAYVGGMVNGPFLESDRGCEGRLFKNPYEKTKQEAEQLVHAYGGRKTIYRPAVIVGESETGTTLTFTGFYGLIHGFHLLRMQAMRRLRFHPEELRESGVRLLESGALSLPIVIPASASSTLNLVPVDWVADTMTRLGRKERPCGKVYHLAHPRSISGQEAIEKACRVVGVVGLRFEDPSSLNVLLNDPSMAHDNLALQELQKSILQWLDVYWPYFSFAPVFDLDNVRQTLGSEFIPPRDVDDSFLRVLMGYAVAKHFKQRGVN
jgi:nucleoside-diphosphate-sugar epimerase